MEKKNVRDTINDVVDKICMEYCKYPDIWDEEKEGCDLADSEICRNCPLNEL